MGSAPEGGATATPEAFFAGHPEALEVYRMVRSSLEAMGPVNVRTTRSQVSFRLGRGFAYLWLPGRWLARPDADVVLSIALDRRDDSTRFKEVVHPALKVWMHHLEVHALDDVDEQVVGWLREARAHAGER